MLGSIILPRSIVGPRYLLLNSTAISSSCIFQVAAENLASRYVEINTAKVYVRHALIFCSYVSTLINMNLSMNIYIYKCVCLCMCYLSKVWKDHAILL